MNKIGDFAWGIYIGTIIGVLLASILTRHLLSDPDYLDYKKQKKIGNYQGSTCLKGETK